LPLFLGILMAAQASFAQPASVIRSYVTQFKDIAIEEMKRTGVPASITLAQGIHETMAGTSVLVRKSNNHFGIKCKETWTGASVNHDDDAPQECFRKYDNAFDSYRDHSDFLKTRKHYNALFSLDPTDYESWAYGLKKAGYATNPKYPQILIKLIRDYNLHDYTLVAMGQKTEGPDVLWAQGITTPAASQPVAAVARTVVAEPAALPAPIMPLYPSGVFRINDTKVKYITKGTSYLQVAEEHNMPLSRLFDFNDMAPQETADADGLLYLQRKRKSGNNETHKVGFGETLYSIAQSEGIRLESLLALNHLQPSQQPEIGETLYLKHKAAGMPRLATTMAKADLPQVVQQSVQQAGGPAQPVNMVPLQASEPTGGSYTEHIVQPKETLYAISRKYSVSIEEIMKWNDMQDMNLRSGQALRIRK
ncbi:glucosaminidase domain-containing protein, partial [Cnuella takakiae]